MADCSDRKISIASVIVDKTIEFMSVVLFIFAGVVILFYRIPLPVKLKTYFIVGLSLAIIMVLFLFSKQKKGLLGWIVDVIHKINLHPKFVEKNIQKIKETDVYISEFYKSNSIAFIKTFLLYALLTLIWVVEIHIGLIFIGVTDMPFVDSFLITVLGNLGLMIPIIPGSLGVYEATYIGLFALVGKGADVALTLVLIRRLIALLLAGFGLLGMLKPIPKQEE